MEDQLHLSDYGKGRMEGLLWAKLSARNFYFMDLERDLLNANLTHT